ncbi:DUF4124 domain-containing protein [Pseudomonas sp. KNUC1026]|uniref:DUF4124 domain-containing protein n=1 Tax=Pseudomonas sp. KNUC1026 TaxID=2893890 RepID=UPI001F17DBFF|nr:DUF4124 domain-containing protein [Pseudomonas sp. KNUC1026]UFH50005.1 DUF4124 domain-containing protein [Pseudomonas sp. KNUC1026]
MRIKSLIAVAVLVASSSAGAAQIYKWTDAQGVQHFDTQPPPGQQAKPVQINTPAPATPAGEEGEDTAPARPSGNGGDAAQRQADAAAKAEANDQQRQIDDYCKQARENLARLRNNPRLSMTTEEGEVRRMTQQDRDTQIATTQKGINDNCQN